MTSTDAAPGFASRLARAWNGDGLPHEGGPRHARQPCLPEVAILRAVEVLQHPLQQGHAPVELLGRRLVVRASDLGVAEMIQLTQIVDPRSRSSWMCPTARRKPS